MTRRTILVLSALLVVGNCAYIQEILPPDGGRKDPVLASPTPSHAPESTDSTSLPAPEPAPADRTARRAPDVASPAPTGRPGPRSPSAPPPSIDPTALVGLDEAQAGTVLGKPRAIHQQPPATVWMYRAEGCELSMFFYMDMASRKLHVLTYEVKTPDGNPSQEAVNRCVGRIQTTYRGKL